MQHALASCTSREIAEGQKCDPAFGGLTMGWLAMEGRVVSGGGGCGGCEGVAGCEGEGDSSFSLGAVYASIISPVPCGVRYQVQQSVIGTRQQTASADPWLACSSCVQRLGRKLAHAASKHTSGASRVLRTFSSARAMAALRFALALSAGCALPPSASYKCKASSSATRLHLKDKVCRCTPALQVLTAAQQHPHWQGKGGSQCHHKERQTLPGCASPVASASSFSNAGDWSDADSATV